MSLSITNALPTLLLFPKDRQLIRLVNWATFCDHLKSVARATGLSGYLDGSIPSPTPAAPNAQGAALTPTSVNSCSPSVEEWELCDARIASIIYQNVKDPRSMGITQDMSAQVMWSALTTE
ncbi:hypothetical protein GYMLUDRAFT_161254, partial [Collybiopsis luxurians FD-317 M1]